jgi:4-methylaminobutanoate oxidase (formaldehyde-forming)
MDLWGNDIRRMFPFQSTQKYIQHRVSETLGLLYDNHYPYKQMETARNLRHSPLHERLLEQRACFGEAAGWERPNWFAPAGVEPKYEYSFGKQNWFEHSAAEHKAARENVVLFDQSSFSKYLVQGRDAVKLLQRVSSAKRILGDQWCDTDHQGPALAEIAYCRRRDVLCQ